MNDIFYKKKFYLPMGSPLCGVLACIYLEFLESSPFKCIIPNTAHYFRYIDDIQLIYPQSLDLHNITDRLNNVEPSIKFTCELAYNSTLPFLDILLMRNINKLEFKVYRKPTCKNDQIHFYSHHNNNTKRGIIIGFYLSVLRICSSKYLNDEFIHIENSFLNLLYPKSFIQFAKSKALKIHNKNQPQINAHSQSYKNSSPHRFLTLPNNSSSHSMWGLKAFEGQGLRARLRYPTPYFGYTVSPHVDWPAQRLAQRKSQKKYTKRKDRKKIRGENISSVLSFIYWVKGLTNATSCDAAWCL